MQYHNIIDFIFFRVIKLSGLLWLIVVWLGGVATGQTDASHKYYWMANGISLIMLIVARIEGYRSVK